MHWLRSRLGAAWQATGAFGLRSARFVTACGVLCSAEAWVQWLRKRGKAQFSALLESTHLRPVQRSQVVAMRSAPQLLAAWRWLRVHAAARSGQRGRREPDTLCACLPALAFTFCAPLSPQAKRARRRARRRRRRMVRGPGSGGVKV